VKAAKHKTSRLAVCISNRGFAASLELRKVYPVIHDADAESHRMVRVVDESGEDYLFSETCFVGIDLPALEIASTTSRYFSFRGPLLSYYPIMVRSSDRDRGLPSHS